MLLMEGYAQKSDFCAVLEDMVDSCEKEPLLKYVDSNSPGSKSRTSVQWSMTGLYSSSDSLHWEKLRSSGTWCLFSSVHSSSCGFSLEEKGQRIA